mmetsp:Transcript_2063/g.5846  ORF Transcript_2063/g.5846 Transcript_2063/m.5846 type:complete len:227 (-) Transcript_2063:6-686(-)
MIRLREQSIYLMQTGGMGRRGDRASSRSDSRSGRGRGKGSGAGPATLGRQSGAAGTRSARRVAEVPAAAADAVVRAGAAVEIVVGAEEGRDDVAAGFAKEHAVVAEVDYDIALGAAVVVVHLPDGDRYVLSLVAVQVVVLAHDRNLVVVGPAGECVVHALLGVDEILPVARVDLVVVRVLEPDLVVALERLEVVRARAAHEEAVVELREFDVRDEDLRRDDAHAPV